MSTLIDSAVAPNPRCDRSIRRILLVDDEIDVWWGHNLPSRATSGYTVDTADDGEAAWDALQTRTYDLLITDNKMPNLFGMDLIKRVRSHGFYLPIIFASTMLPAIPPGDRHYFQDVRLLEKPLSSSQLLGVIEKFKLKPETKPVQHCGWTAPLFGNLPWCLNGRALATPKLA